jgi:hypothetical protein
MNLKCFAICFLFFSFSLFAQEKTRISTIQGQVTSLSKIPVEFGSVFVLTTDTSVVTQGFLFDGIFELDSVPFGNYFLVIRANYFQDLDINIQVSDTLLIFNTLEMRQIQTIDEVTVSTERPKLTFDVGKYDVQVRDQPYFEGQKALEIIAKLPGVIVDNNTIYMNGVVVNTIRIDGMDYSLESATLLLETLTNDEIEKITIIKDDFAKSDAVSSGGIIDIKTFNAQKHSHHFEVFTDQGFGRRYRNNEGLIYHFNKNSFTFSVGVYRNDNSYFKDSEYNRFYANSGLNLSQTVENEYTAVNYPIHVGINYSFNNNHSVAASYFGFPQKTSSERMNRNFSDRDSSNFQLETDNISLKKDFNQEFGLQYVYLSDSGNFEFMLRNSMYILTSNSVGYFNERSISTDSSLNWSHYFDLLSDSRNQNNASSIDLNHWFLNRKLKMSYGAKLSILRLRNKQEFIRSSVLDVFKSNDNSYSEDVGAGYIELKYNLSDKIKVISGLRYENVSLLGKSNLLGTVFAKRNYDNWFPSLGVSYEKSKKISLTAYYCNRIERPNLNDLNPFILYHDSLSYNSGNPLLVPSIYNNIGLDIVLRRIVGINAYFKNIYDYQSYFISPLSSSSDTYVLTTFNFPKAQISGASVSMPTPKFKGIVAFVNIGWSYNKTWVVDNSYIDGHNYYASISPSYTTKNKRFSMNGFGYFRSSGTSGIFNSQLLWRVDFGVNYRFLKDKNLKVGLYGVDIFNSLITSVNASLPAIQVSGTEFRDIRKFKIELSYSIGVKSEVKQALDDEEKERLINSN